MHAKILLIGLLATIGFSVYSTENISDKIDWDKYEKMFIDKNGCLYPSVTVAKYYFNWLKTGVDEGIIKFSSKMSKEQDSPDDGFVAYVESEVEGKAQACIIGGVCSLYTEVMNGVADKGKSRFSAVYALAIASSVTFSAFGFTQCEFDKNELHLCNSLLLPEQLHPKQKDMVYWKDPFAFAVYVKWINQKKTNTLLNLQQNFCKNNEK